MFSAVCMVLYSEITNAVTIFFTQILKLYAWEESFLSDINSKRAKELRYLLLSGLLRAVLTLIFNTLPVMVGNREF